MPLVEFSGAPHHTVEDSQCFGELTVLLHIHSVRVVYSVVSAGGVADLHQRLWCDQSLPRGFDVPLARCSWTAVV